jgi:predicted  nucleic acid-binding Zn-ribbon protein
VEAISVAQARLATEIASLQAHRSELLPDIPSAVLDLYEKILIKVRDVAAVELVDGICGGCKIAGVAMDIGRWRTSTVDSLVTCPACARLWIPAS